jgi:hypothetical protein
MKSEMFGCELIGLTDDDLSPQTEYRMIASLYAAMKQLIATAKEKYGIVINSSDLRVIRSDDINEVDVEWVHPASKTIYTMAISGSAWAKNQELRGWNMPIDPDMEWHISQDYVKLVRVLPESKYEIIKLSPRGDGDPTDAAIDCWLRWKGRK